MGHSTPTSESRPHCAALVHVHLLLTPRALPSRLSTCCLPYVPPPMLTCHYLPSLCHPPSPFAHLPPSCLASHPLQPPALFVAQPSTCNHRHGPHLHVCPPLPVPPSHLMPCHSHDVIVTNHPRHTVIAEAAPHQPPGRTPAPTTTIPGVGWWWVRTVRGDMEARTYMHTSSHRTLPPPLIYWDPTQLQPLHMPPPSPCHCHPLSSCPHLLG